VVVAPLQGEGLAHQQHAVGARASYSTRVVAATTVAIESEKTLSVGAEQQKKYLGNEICLVSTKGSVV
jgi:hypothetical protein